MFLNVELQRCRRLAEIQRILDIFTMFFQD